MIFLVNHQQLLSGSEQLATEVEKSTYKWVKKHDAIKLIFFLGIAAICFSFFLPYGLVFFFAGLLTLLFCRDYKKWNNNWHYRSPSKEDLNLALKNL